jgi:hypothetical protein
MRSGIAHLATAMLVVFSCVQVSAQVDYFPKHNLSLYMTTGEINNNEPVYGWEAYTSVGLGYGYRFHQNITALVRTHAINKDVRYVDLGFKFNAFVHHRLQFMGQFTYNLPSGFLVGGTMVSFGPELHLGDNFALSANLGYSPQLENVMWAGGLTVKF